MIVCVLHVFAIINVKCQRSEHAHEVWCACPRFSVCTVKTHAVIDYYAVQLYRYSRDIPLEGLEMLWHCMRVVNAPWQVHVLH